MNAICERLAGTLRRELPDRVLILGDGHLHAVLTEYQLHCNTARPHQGIAQRVPDGEHRTITDPDPGRIHRKPVLGGLINENSRAARYPEDPQVTSRILFSSGTGWGLRRCAGTWTGKGASLSQPGTGSIVSTRLPHVGDST